MSAQKTDVTPIIAGWRFREVCGGDASPAQALPWLPAIVPGHVHDDLRREGVIPDPFRDLHERTVQWVDETDWEYEATFEWAPEPGETFVRFLGLDTVATVWLNGQVLGQSDNVFVPHEFRATKLLRGGENNLRVVFRSARRVGRDRQAAWQASGEDTMPRVWNVWDERAFVRKAQYMYGWDWGPELASCGIWRPVELVTVPVARIADWRHSVAFSADGGAEVRVSATAERVNGSNPGPLALAVALDGVEQTVVIGAGEIAGETTFRIAEPRRWWPNGCGTADLYELRLELRLGDETLDAAEARIGLREVELVREPDAEGDGFLFRVNGRDVFAKGANWVPADSFPSRLEWPEGRDRVRALLERARETGLNMLRVWGGGLYESDDFYDECDRLGILVWQDFPYACAYYPDTGPYAEAAREEAVLAVRRLRHHASLAIWCGNNENGAMFHDGWGGARPPRLLGDNLYHGVLPEVVATEDADRPYWPSSPWSGENPSSPETGDRHNWDVWHGSGDWTRYADDNSRFVSEFGFAASCGLAAWATVLPDVDPPADAAAVQWHDKTRKGYERYLDYIAEFFPRPGSLEDLVYYSQANQAEALKFGVEHYRRLMGRCWGTLFWQWNDCWPVQSWAVVDYAGEQKLACHAARRFFAPLLVSLAREGSLAGAWLVNDGTTPVPGRLDLSLRLFSGETLSRWSGEAEAPPNASVRAGGLDLSAATGREGSVFVHARFEPATGTAVENLLFLARPKELALPAPGVSVDSVAAREDGALEVTLCAASFAAWVWLRAEGTMVEWSDNGFHMLPGEKRAVLVRGSGVSPARLRESLVIRTLADG